MTIVAKTKKYLASLLGHNRYIVPEKELKLPWRGWEAEHHGIDPGSVTVIMYFPRIGSMAKAREENRLL